MRRGAHWVPPQNAEQFNNYLKSNKLKLTSERVAILEQVFAYDDHFRAEDLLVRMRQNGHQVSRATIYRTLPLLVKSGLLTEVIDAQKQSHYEHINALQQQHAHLICLRCGKLIEFKNVEIDSLQESVCKAYGFKPIKYRNEILGYCFECQAEGL
jgi:Fur family ferric uptake transcriptional regulator